MSTAGNSSVSVPPLGSLQTLLPSPSPSLAPAPLPSPALPILLAVLCIVLLFATCALFLALCKPASLEEARYGPRECMPYHSADASEPQLRLWKRLGSLRSSLSSFRRTRPLSLAQRPLQRRTRQHAQQQLSPRCAEQQLQIIESTKM
ncbi:hypothetical protein AOXY_G14746 [Acipenser oxyrinchus oxyrinchus]|uniref:Uncharacterized protein n=1 Tax=Acipenser oxyrinchus oxyrinchus TaxID=40147 RepID=A0AAD8D6B5_ACIOX|nr:hypothetical protein AOXY_G14746 [Acipenser oxyrinchus oxyrinchus]